MSALLLLAVGLGMLILGADRLVQAASKLADSLGVPDLVIGLTVVAFGTSTPELAVSVISAYQNKPEIAIGNVIGSNLFNLLGVLGISAIASSNGIPVEVGFLKFDFPVMMLATLTLVPLAVGNRPIGRIAGAVLIFGYFGYTALLLMS